MKIKCSFCMTGYDTEKNQGYCPNCGKKYDGVEENYDNAPQSFAPYTSQGYAQEEQQEEAYGGNSYQSPERPSYVNHSTVNPPSLASYQNRPKIGVMSGGKIAAIIVVATMVVTTFIIMFISTSAKDHDDAYDEYVEMSRSEALGAAVKLGDFQQQYIDSYTYDAAPKEQLEALIYDFQTEELYSRAQFDDSFFSGFIITRTKTEFMIYWKRQQRKVATRCCLPRFIFFAIIFQRMKNT